MQIFISSNTVKYDSIIDSIHFLCKKGYKNIELTGGNKYEEKLIEKIKKIKEKFSLEFIFAQLFSCSKRRFCY